MNNVLDTIAREASAIEQIDSSEPVQMPDMSVGDMYAQGDIGLQLVDRLPDGAKVRKVPKGDYQIAPGNTKGSRHIIPARCMADVTVYDVQVDDLCDTALVTQAPIDLLHPEHGDHLGYAAGIYLVRHEQNEQRQRSNLRDEKRERCRQNEHGQQHQGQKPRAHQSSTRWCQGPQGAGG